MIDRLSPNSASKRDVVAFKVAGQDFCIDISSVREIRVWTPTTVLPHAPDYVKGVINLRGSVVAVVDLSERLGLGRTQESARSVIIIVMVNAQVVGLLADVVSDILGLPDGALTPVPDIASEVARSFIEGMVTQEDGRILRKIDLDRILPVPGRSAA